MNQYLSIHILLILCCFIPLHSSADTGGAEVEHTPIDSLSAQDLADLTNGEFEELFTQMTVEEAEALAKEEGANTPDTENTPPVKDLSPKGKETNTKITTQKRN